MLINDREETGLLNLPVPRRDLQEEEDQDYDDDEEEEASGDVSWDEDNNLDFDTMGDDEYGETEELTEEYAEADDEYAEAEVDDAYAENEDDDFLALNDQQDYEAALQDDDDMEYYDDEVAGQVDDEYSYEEEEGDEYKFELVEYGTPPGTAAGNVAGGKSLTTNKATTVQDEDDWFNAQYDNTKSNILLPFFLFIVSIVMISLIVRGKRQQQQQGMPTAATRKTYGKIGSSGDEQEVLKSDNYKE